MFWTIPAIIRFSSERVLVFIRFMRLCKDGEISSSVVSVIITIKRPGCQGGGSVMRVLRKVTVSRMRERYVQTVLTFQITYV